MIEQEHKLNWVARMTGFFLRNSQLAIMLFLLIVIAGTVSLVSLRREGFPQVPVKIAVISTSYRGAAPAEVERSVTNPIESAIKGNKNIKELSSSSASGVSFITATIEPSANLDSAIQDINGKVSGVTLPKDAEKPTVFQPATGGAAFYYGLSGDLTPLELEQQGRKFQQEIGAVKGVKQVSPALETKDKLKITYDPAKLVASSVDVSQLNSTISGGNVSFPAGVVISGSDTSNVIFAASYQSQAQLEEVRIPTTNGSTVRLGDIATFEAVVDTNDKLSRFGYSQDGKPVGVAGPTYSITIRDDADILAVDSQLKSTIDRLQRDKILSPKLHLTRLYDQAQSTREQIQEIQAGAFGENWKNLGVFGAAGFLFGGIWLLAIAMAVFVNIRAAIVAVIAVPLSFFVSVISLNFMGVTLNTLTLFSMVLVLGLVVDPVIVMLEALQRFKDRGYVGIDAAMRAVDSVGLGVLMAVLISVIVFTPFGIVSGVFGEIIRFIPITVIPALVASFFIPVLFLTSIGSRLLKSHHKAGADQSEEASLWRVSLWFQRTNLSILKRWWAQGLIILVAFVLPLAIAAFFFGTGKIKSVQFSEPPDTNVIQVTVDYPASRSPAAVLDLATKTEDAISKQHEVTSYFYMEQSTGSFTIFINLTEPADRDIKANEIVTNLKKDLPSEPGTVFANASTISNGPPTPSFPVQLQVFENDPVKLKNFAVDAAKYLKGVDGVTQVSDGYNDGDPAQISVVPNPAALAAAGLTPASFGGQLAAQLGSQPVTKLQLDSGEVQVESRIGGTNPAKTADDVKNITVVGSGGPVAVATVSTVSTAPGVGPIQHFNGNRFATIKARISSDADQVAIQKSLTDWAKSNREKYGLSEDAFTSKGENDDIVKSFSELFLALAAAILLTYTVLVVFFRSFLQPLIITFAVPLSFIGVFPAIYWFGGGQFGFLEILGMITLVGIVENVGIFVIDYANRRVKEGMEHKQAIALATAVRFRPIFLTKICALGSLLPLAIISPFWRGLASVIVAGILTSGITSLFTTPILYHWVHNINHLPGKLRERRQRRKNRTNTTKPASTIQL
jgi:hydrophobic/amphiphilic exporter-1 (mainly G- bacteria), HAE1 family